MALPGLRPWQRAVEGDMLVQGPGREGAEALMGDDRVCGTCRFWTREPIFTDIRGCATPVAGECCGIAACWDWRLDPGDPEPEEKALLVDANARLLTTEDFGCALWEAEP